MVSFGRSMVSFVVWLSLSFMGGRGCKLLGIVYFDSVGAHAYRFVLVVVML